MGGATVSNIMFDRRVVRGNTYAARILAAELGQTSEMKSTSGTSKRKTTGVRQAPGTPEPIEGRRHMDIQTDQYLEELTDTVPEADNATQTDAFLDRPPTPVFVPQKTGQDATTQIENGDLFDFDFECEPILEVLVGKILEQGLMEVLEEEELAAMRAHQEHFEQVRNSELVATQRMEAAEKRKVEEKSRRIIQEKDRLERERVVREKVAASTFSRGYLSGIVASVFDRLQAAGHFYDPVLREVEEGFMPWLKAEAEGYLSQGLITRQVVRRLVESATEQLAQNREAATAKLRQSQAQAAAWEAKQAEVSQALGDAEAARQAGLGAFILETLEPKVLSEEQIEGLREELVEAAAAKAGVALEAERSAAGEAARAAAEQKQADREAALEAARTAAAEEAGEEGLPEDWQPSEEETSSIPPPVDVEAEVAAAMAAIKAAEPVAPTLDNILGAALDKGLLTKDAIVQAMAVDAMGPEAWHRSEPFTRAPEPEPVAPPPPKGKK